MDEPPPSEEGVCVQLMQESLVGVDVYTAAAAHCSTLASTAPPARASLGLLQISTSKSNDWEAHRNPGIFNPCRAPRLRLLMFA